MKNPFRIGAKVYLRPVESEDLPLLQRWMNDPEVTRHLAAYRPMSADAERRWLASLADRPDDTVLVIVCRDGDVPVGTVGLRGAGGPHRRAVLGISIGEKSCWNRGLGTDAMRLICAYGFDTLNLHRIELEVYAGNSRARHVYERIGFRLEGVRREAHWAEGAWEDVFVMALLETDWRARRPAVRREPARTEPGASDPAESSADERFTPVECWPGAV